MATAGGTLHKPGDPATADADSPDDEPEMDPEVGEVLRAVRRRKRLSLHAVEQATGHEFKASVLGAYERGDRAISVPRLQRLARFYNVTVDQLLPRGGVAADEPPIDLVKAEESAHAVGTGGAGPLTIDLTKLDSLPDAERDVLGRYARMIQSRRQGFDGSALTIRAEDLQTIACLLEVSAESLPRRLDELGVRAG